MDEGAPDSDVTLARALLGCVFDLLAFLELSDESMVNGDAAVVATESVAYAFGLLRPDEQEWIVRTTHALAERAGQGDRKDFLMALPERLGLVGVAPVSRTV